MEKEYSLPHPFLMSQIEHSSTALRYHDHLRIEKEFKRTPSQSSSNNQYDVASLISHGIRTPLSSILGFREILQDSALLSEAERDEFHRVIESDGRRLSRFVLTLRDFMDLSEGRLHLEKSTADLVATVRQAINGCADDARARNVRLLSAISPHPLQVLADHTRLRTAIEQVIANAVQATPAEGRVVVQLYRTSGPAIISVADTGIGIPSADMEKITGAFYRVDRRDGAESRLGLGLTFARALAEMHDGSLVVNSREAVGSMVVIRIPHQEVA